MWYYRIRLAHRPPFFFSRKFANFGLRQTYREIAICLLPTFTIYIGWPLRHNLYQNILSQFIKFNLCSFNGTEKQWIHVQFIDCVISSQWFELTLFKSTCNYNFCILMRFARMQPTTVQVSCQGGGEGWLLHIKRSFRNISSEIFAMFQIYFYH